MDAVLQPVLGVFAWSMMLSVGLDLPWRKLGEVARRPGRFVLAMVLNYVAVPLMALGLLHALDAPAAVWPAVVLFAAAPGGPMGGFLAQQARGDLAMAVAILLGVNLANPLITPAWVEIAGIGTGEVDFLGIFKTLLLFQLLPLVLGLGLRERSEELAARWQPRFATFATILLVLMVLGIGAAKGEILFDLDWRALVVTLGVVVGSLALGLLFGMGAPGMPAALSLTAGVRNGSMALMLVGAWFPDPVTLVAGIGYSVVMFPISLLLMAVLRKRAVMADAAAAPGLPTD